MGSLKMWGRLMSQSVETYCDADVRVEPIETAIRRLQHQINESDWRGDDVCFLKSRLEALLRNKENGSKWSVNF